MKPRISILMPVKNYARYLPACITSIIQQSESDWELLATDDHSSDNSMEIIRAFAKQDPRIRPLTNEGQGIIAALRTAFRHSRGQFITRMDADDLMPPEKLHLLFTALQNKGQLALGLVSYFADKGKQPGPGYLRYEQWLNQTIKKQQVYQQIYRECTIPSCAWMCQREDLVKARAFEPNVYPEDYDLCFRFYQAGLQVAAVHEIVHLWRDHDQRISRNEPAYADYTYLDLKLPYFLKLDYHAERPLVLYGAGKKGKRLAAMLHKKNVPFHWLCNRPGKWGKSMYNTTWQPPRFIHELPNPQIILATADRRAQKELNTLLHLQQRSEGTDYFWFT